MKQHNERVSRTHKIRLADWQFHHCKAQHRVCSTFPRVGVSKERERKKKSRPVIDQIDLFNRTNAFYFAKF